MKDVVNELLTEIFNQAREIEEQNERGKIFFTLGKCFRLNREGNDKEAWNLLQIVKTQLKIDFPDFKQEDQMINFQYEPLKTVIVQRLAKETLDNFIDIAVNVDSKGFHWVDGLVIVISELEDMEETIKQKMNGIQYLDSVTFTKLEKYQKMICRKDGRVEVPLWDYSNQPFFKELVAWIKTQPIWEDKTEPLENS